MYPILSFLHNLSEYQLEQIIEDVIASRTIGHELEGLAVVHWSLLRVDLKNNNVSQSLFFACLPKLHTKSAPVTKIRIPPWSPEG